MLAVLEYNLVGYRRTWRSSALSSFVLPLLTVLGFGLSVGGFVDQGIDGVPYLDWMVPGLLAGTAMNVALSESTFTVLSGFEWINVYFAQLASPLRVLDMLAGHLAYVLVRVLVSCAAFLAVRAPAGARPRSPSATSARCAPARRTGSSSCPGSSSRCSTCSRSASGWGR